MSEAFAIKKVGVIGAGVMGAGIAAQVANAGVPVVLLDIVPKDLPKDADRDTIAKGAIEKLKKSNPAALMHSKNAGLITPGNTEDGLDLLADCDWVIEVVIERLDIKQALYKRLAKVVRKDAIVSSNTSTIPLATLMEGMPKGFRERFCITHFFNPPRYLRLLELVAGADTLPDVMRAVEDFGDKMLGKSIVHAFDTPGFVANRIGTYWLHAAITEAIRHNVDVESADAVMGKPIGVPKTGVFGLVDLVGLDLMPHVLDSMVHALPKDDAFHALGEPPALLAKMIKDGYTGRKGKGGFYRLDDAKNKLVMDLARGEYVPAKRKKLAAADASKKGGLRALVTHDSNEGRYAWSVLRGVLVYSANLVGEIAADLETLDRGMRLGYNWKYGPFELMDKLGTGWLRDKLKADGVRIPKILEVADGRPFYRVEGGRLQFLGLYGKYHDVERPAGVLLLEDIKRRSKPLFGNGSASVWDIGDKVACLEFHSKMNSLNPFIMFTLRKAIKKLPKMGYKGMVLYNEGSNFSVGANIGMLMVGQWLRLWPFIWWVLWHGQTTYQQMKYASFPIVGAPSGMALGGGCEALLHCHALEAHAETYIGLVEGGVGIVPGWGGCKELLGRAIRQLKGKRNGPMPPVVHAFETIGTAKVAKSAAEAKDLMFLRPTDGIVMNRDRVLASAKARVLVMAANHKPEEPFTYVLPGASGVAALELALHDFAKKGLATPHDVVVGRGLAKVLTGGAKGDITCVLTEEDILKLERDVFVPLTKTKGTRDRVAHMLKKGKPLRN